MKRYYVLTTTHPHHLATGDGFDTLEDASTYTSLTAAMREQKDFAKRTNMTTYLLRVEVMNEVEGEL